MASFGQNPYGAPNPLTPNMVPPVVKNTVQTGETTAINWYLQNSGTAYDQQDKTANRAVQVSTTLMIASLAVSAAGPEAAPIAFALDMASNIAGMVGYGMELHDALKSHNKAMETEAIIGIVASGIGMGGDASALMKGTEIAAKFASKGAEISSRFASKLADASHYISEARRPAEEAVKLTRTETLKAEDMFKDAQFRRKYGMKIKGPAYTSKANFEEHLLRQKKIAKQSERDAAKSLRYEATRAAMEKNVAAVTKIGSKILAPLATRETRLAVRFGVHVLHRR